MSESFAMTIVKQQCKIIVVLILALFISNMAWLYVFQCYDYETTTTEKTITVDSGESGGDAKYVEGDVIYGEGKSGSEGNNNQKK